MSTIPRRKAKEVSASDPDAVWNIKTIAVLAAVLICICVLFYAVVEVWKSRVASLPREFEGRIIEKHRGGSDTESSSHRYYRLLIEIDGQRLAVPVNPDIYEQAQVGMVLKRSEKGLEVLRSPNR